MPAAEKPRRTLVVFSQYTPASDGGLPFSPEAGDVDTSQARYSRCKSSLAESPPRRVSEAFDLLLNLPARYPTNSAQA
jgi:hypothetical protein